MRRLHFAWGTHFPYGGRFVLVTVNVIVVRWSPWVGCCGLG